MNKSYCVICNKECKEGTKINNDIICDKCLEKLAHVSLDTCIYEYYKNKIKKVYKQGERNID